MTVYEKDFPADTHENRRLRAEDGRVRYSLGLRYVGLRYGPFNTTPRELYRDGTGQQFIRVSLGVYKPV